MTAIKEPEPIQQTAFAPGSHFADPAALGLGGFALTTFVLSVANANIVPIAVTPVVFGLALAYGGIAQFAAGIWEFAKGNTFGATAFCSYGGFWVSYWYLTGHTDLSGAGSNVNQGVGLYLIAWAIFTGYMMIAAMKTNMAVLAVFILLTITYILLSIGEFATADGITHIGGYVGIATAIAAWYASFATVANFTFKRTAVPVGPLA
ncbi:MAG: acetate uptake transporter [Nocardioidaceae bacterium]